MDAGELLDTVKAYGSERYIADRVSALRKSRGWSQDELVKRMRQVGCVIPQSAISKLEKPPPGGRRAVTVDEALGFAKVFGLSIEELVLPPDLVERRHLYDSLLEGAHVWWRHVEARHDYEQLMLRQRDAMLQDNEWDAQVRTMLEETEANQPEGDEPSFARVQQRAFLQNLVALADEAKS